MPQTNPAPYELASLEKAVRYQQWIINTIQPFLGKRILELGAGIGNMSRWLSPADRLILTELDPDLLQQLTSRIAEWFPDSPHITTQSLDIANQPFSDLLADDIDTIISFNVLEHIEDDHAVFQKCADLLRKSSAQGKKRMISFVPAHMWAYGQVDKQVGHYRRYNRKMFKALHQKITPDAKLILKPFNLVGLLGWIINGRILKNQTAGSNAIKVFETLCPIIQRIDTVLIKHCRLPIGQSLLAIQEF